MNKEFISKVSNIQKTLKAPKNQWNNFGKYNYRSCEDILEGLKPILDGLVITLCDDMILIGDRFYLKATATLTDGESSISNSAFARESLTKKGMDDSQITGTASSYARKYALNGLFGIDDTKDADGVNEQGNTGFVLDDIAISWVNACKADISVLEQIKDPAYKEFIRNNL